MEQRKQIEAIAYKILNEGDDIDTFENCIDDLAQLIPRWKTFSEDCKPEVGKPFAIRNRQGEYVFTGMWKGNKHDIDFHIQFKYQFLQLPD